MEPQTQFDLNRSLTQWREQLAHSPAIKRDNLVELEAHLRDSMAALQARGLSEEEALLVATKRLGQPAQLVTEFGKSNLADVWFNRLVWAMIGLAVFRVMQVSLAAVALFSEKWAKPACELAIKFAGWVRGVPYENTTFNTQIAQIVAYWLLLALVAIVWFLFFRWLFARDINFTLKTKSPMRFLLIVTTATCLAVTVISSLPWFVFKFNLSWSAWKHGSLRGTIGSLMFSLGLQICAALAWRASFKHEEPRNTPAD